MGFLGGAVVKKKKKKTSPDNARNSMDVGLIPGWGRSLLGGKGNPLQYSCLENSMNRGAWWATVHKVVMECTHTPNSKD